MSINEDVYEDAVCLFYANMTIPDVPEGTDPIIQSNLLGTQKEFILSDLCHIDLPNVGDHVYLAAFDDFPA